MQAVCSLSLPGGAPGGRGCYLAREARSLPRGHPTAGASRPGRTGTPGACRHCMRHALQPCRAAGVHSAAPGLLRRYSSCRLQTPGTGRAALECNDCACRGPPARRGHPAGRPPPAGSAQPRPGPCQTWDGRGGHWTPEHATPCFAWDPALHAALPGWHVPRPARPSPGVAHATDAGLWCRLAKLLHHQGLAQLPRHLPGLSGAGGCSASGSGGSELKVGSLERRSMLLGLARETLC